MPAPPDIPRRIAGFEVPCDDVSIATWQWATRRLPEYLLAHSTRVYAWAAALARADRLAFEPRILWPASLLHDVGLTRISRNTRCFEYQGAATARRFLVRQGMTADFATRARGSSFTTPRTWPCR